MRLICLSLFLMLGLAGCSSTVPAPTTLPEKEAEKPLPLPPMAKDGSLYRSGYMLNLFQDRRAYRLGDVLTVMLEERTSSSKQAGTKMGRSSGANFGGNYSVPAGSAELGLGISNKHNFKGDASSTQQNKLSGSITVMVREVLPNGMLRISGEKWLRLNQGDELIQVSGIVRTDDIDAGNRISSQRIADASIVYTGKGVLAGSNSPGWLTRLFNSSFSLL